MTPEQMVGRRVTELRERAGMTQQQLGDRLGDLLEKPWPRQTVSLAEKGRRGLTAVELMALAQVLGTTVGRLLLPPIDVEEIEMPSGTTLGRAEIERTVLDSETRNVVPLASEAVRRVANYINDRIAKDSIELRELASVYEVLAPGGRVSTDAHEARSVEIVRDVPHGNEGEQGMVDD